MAPCISGISLSVIDITPKTRWTFLTLTDPDGLTGVGEATLTGRESEIVAIAERLRATLTGANLDEAALMAVLPFATLPEAAFSSAVLQAAADLAARAAGRSVAVALGGALRDKIPLYANINRRTLDRGLAGFAASAGDALDVGYRALKIAPFDGLTLGMDQAESRPLLAAGLDRIAAVRDRAGPDVRLMVDCHWRFDEAASVALIRDLKPLGLYWLECPIPDELGSLAALRRLRGLANDAGMRLAGAETMIRLEGFRPLFEAGAYDVMMPDMKYAGGPGELMRIAEAFAEAGVEFSPHNPSGPICHAHSLQLCAAVEKVDLLEIQFDEAAAFIELLEPRLPEIREAAASLPVEGHGIGVGLGVLHADGNPPTPLLAKGGDANESALLAKGVHSDQS